MDFHISRELDKRFKKIKDRDKQLSTRIHKQLELFQQNHLHPSLKVHKLAGRLRDLWSMSIDKSYRMTYFLIEGEAYFVDIGTHDQVYKW